MEFIEKLKKAKHNDPAYDTERNYIKRTCWEASKIHSTDNSFEFNCITYRCAFWIWHPEFRDDGIGKCGLICRQERG